MKYCPKCGQPSWVALANSYTCEVCGFALYLNTAAAVAGIVTCRGFILATIRAQDPDAGTLDLPGGFVDYGETAEQALRRELREELGLTGFTPAYFGTYPNVYPYRSVTYHTLDLFFTIDLPTRPPIVALDDVAEVRWIKRSQIDTQAFGFVSMREALTDYTRLG